MLKNFAVAKNLFTILQGKKSYDSNNMMKFGVCSSKKDWDCCKKASSKIPDTLLQTI